MVDISARCESPFCNVQRGQSSGRERGREEGF